MTRDLPDETLVLPADASWSAADLAWVVRTALDRGAHLLTAGELHVVRTLLELEPGPLDTFARLNSRSHPIQRMQGVDHVDALLDAGLIDRFVPWRLRAQRSTVAKLKAGLKQLGMKRSGNRAALIERIQGHIGWSPIQWIRARHGALVKRLEQWAFLKARPDRRALVVERLGHVTWPSYACTSGTALFRTRQALLNWERTQHESSPEALCVALEAGHARGPGKLDRRRSIARRVLEGARDIERSQDAPRARALYRRVAREVPRYATRCTLRIARTHESEGENRKAFRLLHDHRAQAIGPDRLALNRAGRRTARQVRAGWAPDKPPPLLVERSVSLRASVHSGLRPTFRGGLFVEEAVIDLLASHGRQAVHAEGSFWLTLFAHLFSDAYFMAIPGQLPVPQLSGPLDIGTPEFAHRRASRIDTLLDAIQAGDAEHLVRRTQNDFPATRLAGCRWKGDGSTLPMLAAAIPIPLLENVMQTLLQRGWSAARGLPDLLICPGEAVTLERSLPRRIPSSFLLAEVKTPSDTLSDAQRWWAARLAPHTGVEIWNVSATRVGFG